MNGIAGISFQETDSGLIVHVKKKASTSSTTKLKKRLPYNFKALSSEIMRAKKSDTARPLLMKMKSKLSWLYRQLKNGEYGESEVMAAILHAAAMEKIAKRKIRHLEAEEAVENGNAISNAPSEDDEVYGKDELLKSLEENTNISEEKLQELMEKIEKLEEEITKDTLSELQDMVLYSGKDISEADIKEMKRKHREDEERQLTRADLEYLKSLFNRLEQEKRDNSSSVGSSSYGGSSTISFTVKCVPEVEMADIDIGETVDISV